MSDSLLVYVGTYTTRLAHVDGKADGILIFRLDTGSGRLTRLGCRDGIANPSYVAIEPRRRRLYAACEVKRHAGGEGGLVQAYAIAADGALSPLGTSRATIGMDPCYVDLDATGGMAMVANYTSGSVIAFPLDADGALGEPGAFIQHEIPGAQVARAGAPGGAAAPGRTGADPRRQEGPHAHSCVIDPGRTRMYACDLGCDRIFAYRFDPRTGALTADARAHSATPAGSGPRHLAFHPDGRHAYVMLELTSRVGVVAVEPSSGRLTVIQELPLTGDDYVSQVPAASRGYSSDTGADIQMHPSGRFVYASHRGSDRISAFAIAPGTGLLTLIGRESTQGRTPRSFAIEPGGRFLLAANQDSDSIATLRIDPQSGRLAPTGHVARAETPVCVKVVDDAR
jgi:6-phosphogluconolactonase